MPLDEIGKFQQQVLPLERLDLAPRPLEGAARRGNRAIDVLRIALGNRGKQFTGSGIEGLEGLAGRLYVQEYNDPKTSIDIQGVQTWL